MTVSASITRLPGKEDDVCGLYVTWESLGEIEAPDAETIDVIRRAAKRVMNSSRIEDGIEDPVEAAGVRAEIEDNYQ